MTTTATRTNQEHFIDNATEFFQTIFEPTLKAGYGVIEIRTVSKNPPPQQFFCKERGDSVYWGCPFFIFSHPQ